MMYHSVYDIHNAIHHRHAWFIHRHRCGAHFVWKWMCGRISFFRLFRDVKKNIASLYITSYHLFPYRTRLALYRIRISITHINRIYNTRLYTLYWHYCHSLPNSSFVCSLIGLYFSFASILPFIVPSPIQSQFHLPTSTNVRPSRCLLSLVIVARYTLTFGGSCIGDIHRYIVLPLASSSCRCRRLTLLSTHSSLTRSPLCFTHASVVPYTTSQSSSTSKVRSNDMRVVYR